MNNAEFKQYIKNGEAHLLIRHKSKKLTEEQFTEALNSATKNVISSYYVIEYCSELLKKEQHKGKELTEEQLIEALNIAIKNGSSYYVIEYCSELLKEEHYKLCLQSILNRNWGYDLFIHHNEKLRSKEDRKLCIQNALDNDYDNSLLKYHYDKLTEEEVEYMQKNKILETI